MDPWGAMPLSALMLDESDGGNKAREMVVECSRIGLLAGTLSI